ncbi:MAG TPA: outer membrane beta-barrel protein [Candidatus Limnocylindrales bacterium]|nr:outer membrane beta-barrel protein [Candidatus Limnocylindrales bacterium]
MRKFFVCAGLALAGTTGLQAAYAPDLNQMETAKLWSVSGTLRGFYDDNYNTAPSGSPTKRDSFGFELSPSLSLNVPLQQTELGLKYTYGLYYYQDREQINGRPIDQTHQLDLWVDHAFTERWQAKVMDTLAVGQEPQLVNGGTLYRTEGNNIHNMGAITLDTQWTRLLGTELSYQNDLYDYQNSGGNFLNPSYAGLLNRLEHNIALNVNWRLQPTLLAFIGYQFGLINYTGNEQIGFTLLGPYSSENRDNWSQYGYVGAQYTPLDNLTLSAQAGIQYADYYNPQAGAPATDQLSPFAKLSGTYTYLPGSYVQVGFTQTRNATSVIAITGNTATLDQESSVVYAALNHQITPRLTGNITGQIQYSSFNGGAVNNQSQTWYSVGLNLAYSITPHVSAEIGYNYDDLTSIALYAPGYERNRVYLGVTGTY